MSINLDKRLHCFILSSALLEANHKDLNKEHSLLRFFIISDICPLLHEPNLNRVHSFVQCVIRVPLHQVFGGIFNSFLVIFLCIFDIFELTLEVEFEPLSQRMHLLCLLCRFLQIIFFLFKFVYRLDIVGRSILLGNFTIFSFYFGCLILNRVDHLCSSLVILEAKRHRALLRSHCLI